MHLFQPVVGGMHRSRPLAGSSAHAPFPAVGGINNVAAIQPAVGGGAVVAAPAVGGLAPAIGAGGGGGCHPGNSGDGAAPAAPAAAPAIGAGAGGGSSGDGAAAAAEEPFPEAEIAAAMIADGFKQYHMAAPTAAALPAVGGHESPMEPAVPPPARLAEIRLRSLAEALGNLHGLTPADRRCIVESFQRALRKLREVQALERQDPAENLVQRFYL